MRLAINIPTRGTDIQTEKALETLAISARRNIPGLEGITVPECLMSLLVPTDLDRLESVLEGVAAAASSAMSAPFFFAAPLSRDRMLGGGLGAWPAGDGGYAAVMAAAGVAALQAEGGQNAPDLRKVELEETNVYRHVAEILATTSPAEGEDRWPNVVELERAASNTKLSGVVGNSALELLLREVALVGGETTPSRRESSARRRNQAGKGPGPRPGLLLSLLHLSECSKEPCGVCQPVKKFIEDARISCITQSREEKKSEEMSEDCMDSLAESLADTVVAARRLDPISTLMVGCNQRDEARMLIETIESLSAETHQPVGAYQRPPADASTTRRATMQIALAEQADCSSRTRRRTADITPRSSKRIRVDASPVNSFVGIDAAEETATFSPGDDGEIEPVFAAEDDTSECSFGQSFNNKGDEIIDEQRSLLIVLHHIFTCSKEEGECWATDCDDLKRIWGHARACDRQGCDEAGRNSLGRTSCGEGLQWAAEPGRGPESDHAIMRREFAPSDEGPFRETVEATTTEREDARYGRKFPAMAIKSAGEAKRPMTSLAAQRRKFRISSSRENLASSQESWKREERAKEQAQRALAAAVNANRSRRDRAGARSGGKGVSPEQRHAAASGGEKDEGGGRAPSCSWKHTTSPHTGSGLRGAFGSEQSCPESAATAEVDGAGVGRHASAAASGLVGPDDPAPLSSVAIVPPGEVSREAIWRAQSWDSTRWPREEGLSLTLEQLPARTAGGWGRESAEAREGLDGRQPGGVQAERSCPGGAGAEAFCGGCGAATASWLGWLDEEVVRHRLTGVRLFWTAALGVRGNVERSRQPALGSSGLGDGEASDRRWSGRGIGSGGKGGGGPSAGDSGKRSKRRGDSGSAAGGAGRRKRSGMWRRYWPQPAHRKGRAAGRMLWSWIGRLPTPSSPVPMETARFALVSFLNEVALAEGDDPEQERKQREEAESNGAGAASEPKLVAVHTSKELKFDMVFVTGCDTEPPVTPRRMWWKDDG
eukprot:g13288.t1